MASIAQPLIERVLGDFLVRDKIGEGGFGAVFRAEQRSLKRQAVIKVLHDSHRGQDSFAQRFLREAQLASQLDHPYAAHVYAFGAEPDGLLWIAMELVRGTPLDQLLSRQGPLPLPRFVPLFRRICEVVHAAHEHGIVHRDLKPANVMVLSRSGALLPKLLDFGIAKQHEEQATADEKAALTDTLDGEPPSVSDDIAKAVSETMPPSATDATMSSGLTPARGSGASTKKPTAPTAAGPRTPSDVDASSVVTREGALLGSPAYMAPEQWTNRGVGPRTDVYALGILVFEVLTGRLPYRGSTVMATARAHAHDPVPPLPEHFPEALNVVLRKALAKRAGDRYATALELADALTAASGQSVDRVPLPQLEATLREAILSGAPQPLADAVAALDSARSVHQARDAFWQVVHVTARYLGLVSLACRTRVGPGGAADATPVRELLRTLRHEGLDDAGWVKLAHELAQPFAALADAHPLPELVELFFAKADDGTLVAHDPFAALFSLRSATVNASSEPEVRDALERGLPLLRALLRDLAFLSAYTLAVPRGGVLERWMGTRRSPRKSFPVPEGRVPFDGEPVLLDASGFPVVSLAPLMQAGAPTPGVPTELFLFDGPGRAGARLLALPGSFERNDDRVWTWFREALIEGAAGTAAGVDAEAPYRGLLPYQASDVNRFFGREREAEQLLNRLRRQSFVAVVGPSGAGKSSFVQAGVVPSLPSTWDTITVRPGSAPFVALEAALRRYRSDVTAASLRGDAEALGRLLRGRVGQGDWLARDREVSATGRPVVLVVDQFEELFTMCVDPDERLRYAEALARASRSTDDPVRVIVTLRDDFLMRAQQLAPLRDSLALGLQLLGTPGAEDLRRIVIEPARRAGYAFEDTALPDEMVRAVANEIAALPLLSFTASKLWELRDRHFKQLPRKAYEAIGGVGGALAQHAESLLASLPGQQQGLVREAFRHLVTADGTRAVLSRKELVQILGDDAAAESAVEQLISSRLLVVSESVDRPDQIEIAHEALLSAWPRLVGWRADDAAGAKLRDQLRAAARQWNERGREKGLLWRDDALREYEIWRARHPQGATDVEDAFGRASLDEARRGRRLRRGALVATFVVLAAGLGVLTQANRRTEAQRVIAAQKATEAHDHLAELAEEQGRQYLLGDDPVRALVYLDEAMHLGRDSVGLRYLLARAEGVLAPLEGVMRGHTGKIGWIVLTKDGRRLLTSSADGTVRTWDPVTMQPTATWSGHTGEIVSLLLSDDEKLAVTASHDNTARIWEVATGRCLLTLAKGKSEMWSAMLSGDNKHVVTAGVDGVARIWDTQTGAIVRELPGTEPIAAFYSPDGRTIVTGGERGIVRLWDVATGRLRATMTGHTEQLITLLYSARGEYLATGSFDGTVRLWDAQSGKLLHLLDHAGHRVWRLRFSPDDSMLVTASDEPLARVWDPRTGRLIRELRIGHGTIEGARFSPDGTLIVTWSPDGMTRVWDAKRGTLLQALFSDSPVSAATIDPANRHVFSAGEDGVIRRWDANVRDHGLTMDGANGPISFARFDRTGQRVLTITKDETARAWDATTGAALTTFVPPEKSPPDQLIFRNGAWDADGKRVALAAGKNAIIWNVAGGPPVRLAPHDKPITAVSFSEDGKRVLTAEADGHARVSDDAGKVVSEIDAKKRIFFGHFSDDHHRLILGQESMLTGWNADDGKALFELAGHLRGIEGAAFGPGALIATSSDDHSVLLWRTPSTQAIARLDEAGEINDVAFSPDGALLATANGSNFISVWEVASGRLVWSAHAHSDGVGSIAFSPDGKRLLSASWDGTAVLWSASVDTRSLADLDALIRCRVPWSLESARLVQRKLPASCDAR